VTRGRAEDGFTYIEVLIAMTLMLIIMAATLAVFETTNIRTRDNQKINEAQAQVRSATDQLARRLRNLASPSDAAGATSQQPLERAEAQDLIFRTVNSEGAPSAGNLQNLQRYRYCLDAASRLQVQRQTWTGADPGVPAGTTCPAIGWTSTRIVAQHVTNGARPVFRYELNPSEGVFTELTSVPSASFPFVIGVRETLWVDPQPAVAPGETTLTTRVFLRNQNRPPLASFSAALVKATTVQFNGSASEDPEGNQLSYEWFDNGVMVYPLDGKPNPSALYTAKLAAGTHSITLRVRDAGDLTHTTAAKTQTCTSTLCTVTP
jgi:prepilin-type N-terminal cleavage/methylation domain-containing protein